MDTSKIVFFFVLLLQSGLAFSTLFDMSEHSGIIKGSDGLYRSVSETGTIRTLTSATHNCS